MARQNKWDSKHQKDLERYARQIDAIYQSAVREAAAIGATIPNFSPDKPFSFADYPSTQQRVQKLINSLKNGIQTVILNGVDSEWTLANNKNNELCNVVFGDNVKNLSTEQERRYYRSNGKACDAFKARKTAGLGLSDRVWNYTNQFKTEIEMGIDLGLRDGLSAAEMSRDLRQYLKYPDKLFRRVRDEHGQLHLSKAAKAFNPGQGVYRSSYKNAMRLTRTETNMAYRTSDYTRWQQLDFVVGIEIRTSNNHPIVDICDELAGRYPKDFKFTGWHPQCRCHAVSILKTPEEMEADNESIMNGEELNGESTNRVDDVPQQFKDWTTDNEKRLTTAKSMPYFVRDNEKYFPQMRITDAAAKGVKEAQSFNEKLIELRILFEAQTPQQAIEYITTHIADGCTIDIKKSDLPLINNIINQLADRMDTFGIEKFSKIGVPRNKNAIASWDGTLNELNLNLSKLRNTSSIWRNELKWRNRGIRYSAFVSEEDIVRSTIDHELGHKLLVKYGMKSDAVTTFGKVGVTRNGINEINDILGYYASTEEHEYFAEAFSMYMGPGKDSIIGETKAMLERLMQKITPKRRLL
jgi:hypothetical protein